MYMLKGDERYLVVIPYFHIYAFSVCMMTGLWVGALQIIHPRYDPDAVLASIKRVPPDLLPGRADRLRVALEPPAGSASSGSSTSAISTAAARPARSR